MLHFLLAGVVHALLLFRINHYCGGNDQCMKKFNKIIIYFQVHLSNTLLMMLTIKSTSNKDPEKYSLWILSGLRKPIKYFPNVNSHPNFQWKALSCNLNYIFIQNLKIIIKPNEIYYKMTKPWKETWHLSISKILIIVKNSIKKIRNIWNYYSQPP